MKQVLLNHPIHWLIAFAPLIGSVSELRANERPIVFPDEFWPMRSPRDVGLNAEKTSPVR